MNDWRISLLHVKTEMFKKSFKIKGFLLHLKTERVWHRQLGNRIESANEE
jgi:hypothetical protein